MAGMHAEWACRILYKRFRMLRKSLKQAVRGPFSDTEVVHQLRVSCRRVVASLQILSEFLPDRPRRSMVRRLKRLRQSAGETRDIDVLCQRWCSDKTLRRKHRRRLQSFLNRRREKGLKKLRQELHRIAKDEFQQNYAKLVNHIATRGQTRQAVEKKLLVRALRDYFAGSPGPHVTVKDWHRLRIQGKQLRYKLELFRGTDRKDSISHILSLLAEFQDRLGQMNDHAVAVVRIRRWRRNLSNVKLRKTLKRLARAETDLLHGSLETVRTRWTETRQAELNTSLLELMQLMDRECPAGEMSGSDQQNCEERTVKVDDPVVEF